MINKLAEDIGVKPGSDHLTSWDGIIPALIAGKFDVIIGGLTVTPKRNLTINFSAPYERDEVYLLINKKTSPNLKTLEDINQPGVTISNRRGATTETLTPASSSPRRRRTCSTTRMHRCRKCSTARPR